MAATKDATAETFGQSTVIRRIRDSLRVSLGDDIGLRIQRARKDADLSQQELARQVGLSEGQSISRYERGEIEPPMDRLRLIAEATGKPLSWFIGERPAPARPLVTPMIVTFIDMVSQLTSEEVLEHREPLRDVARALREAVRENTALAEQVEALIERAESEGSTER